MFRVGKKYADPWVTKQLHDCAWATDSLLDITYLRFSSALSTYLKPAEIHPSIDLHTLLPSAPPPSLNPVCSIFPCYRTPPPGQPSQYLPTPPSAISGVSRVQSNWRSLTRAVLHAVHTRVCPRSQRSFRRAFRRACYLECLTRAAEEARW